MLTEERDAPLRLLHLSDFHFSEQRHWDADPVLRELVANIRREVDVGMTPDFIAITGDLAFSGLSEEYKLFGDWLEQRLWPAIGGTLPRDRLLLVPGNHDVDRPSIKRGVRALQTELLNSRSQDVIAEVLADPDESEPLLRRHQAYLQFVARWRGEPQSEPWWQKTFTVRDHRLHIAGLDSAWMSSGDQDHGDLLLGRWQLNQLIGSEASEGADLRIALLHHPWSFLAEFDAGDAEARVHQKCDLVLRGHLHKSRSERIVPPDPTRACLELAAGCAYETSGYANAYQWVELWLGEQAVARVHFRTWRDNEWMPDRNMSGATEGHADFLLCPSPVTAISPAAPQTPAAPARLTLSPDYLAWLHGKYASVELLGHDPQQGRAITLEHVYVPALTTPEQLPAETEEDQARGERPIHPQDRIQLSDRETAPVSLLDRLDRQSLYLPGSPGSGKSTFCRWAVMQIGHAAVYQHPVPAPEGFEEIPPKALQQHLPVLVPLREFWRSMDCGRGQREWNRPALEQALADWLDQQHPKGLAAGGLLDYLKAGRTLLLLDGLDEVPISEPREGHTNFPRALLLSGLQAALPAWEQAGNRVLLTSRPYGLDEGGLARLRLTRAPLEPVPEPLQALFIQRWFHALNQAPLADELLRDLQQRQELEPLRANPMLLTALCVIYGNGKRLPQDRYELYQRIVENVLYSRYKGDAQQREPVRRRLEAIAYGMHTGEHTGTPHTTPVAEVSWREVERNLQVFANQNPAYEQGQVEPAVRREELLTRSGLLLPRDGERAAFYHLSFQEFLAAEYLSRKLWDPAAVEELFAQRGAVAEWHSTLLFLFSSLVVNRDPQQGLDLLNNLATRLSRDSVRKNPAPATLVAQGIQLALAKQYRLPEQLTDVFRRICLDAIEDEIPVQDRQTLGLCLGELGDRRVLDLKDRGAYVEVPAGNYPYGDEDERVTLAEPLLLARYPVTNGQYRAFIEDGGYQNPEWWSKAGWAWREKGDVHEPGQWNNPHWSAPNLPVVTVSFWEAEACCAWAGGRLPTEQEWEAAARGPQGCEYPWCSEWEDGICNSSKAGVGRTSPVGLFPRSRQAALGLEDLSGNVWEWCDSFYEQGGDDAARPRVLRGGAFDYVSRGFLRATYRDGDQPVVRYRFFGFRCVLAPRRQP